MSTKIDVFLVVGDCFDAMLNRKKNFEAAKIKIFISFLVILSSSSFDLTLINLIFISHFRQI